MDYGCAPADTVWLFWTAKPSETLEPECRAEPSKNDTVGNAFPMRSGISPDGPTASNIEVVRISTVPGRNAPFS